MPKASSSSTQPVTVTCTNHLTTEQAQHAWQSLLRDVLFPSVLREETLLPQ
jgi:hypothetical protein